MGVRGAPFHSTLTMMKSEQMFGYFFLVINYNQLLLCFDVEFIHVYTTHNESPCCPLASTTFSTDNLIRLSNFALFFT